MKSIASLSVFLFIAMALWGQPCSTTNGTNCACADGTTNCNLLPDIMISWYGLESDIPTEYSQTGNGLENGRLRITGATPNVGFGPFTVLGTDYFICGTDTIYDPTHSIATCPDGSAPTNLLKQRIYHKNGSIITYTERWAGGQTYHPTHGHNHVDDWVSFTLRTEDPNEPDTLKWPIIGTGSKIGFCLMDLSNCNGSYGDCRDSHVYGRGNILTGSDFPNYGMGGGNYSCSPVEQGISVGFVDIYSQGLEGMWIDIPPGTCNGNYWIVAQVDPRNNFLESNENNNWTAIPYTLTQQVPIGSAAAAVSLSAQPYLCNGNNITLSAIAGQNYSWSTGATSSSITVNQPGDYYVQVTGQCGTAISDTITINSMVSTVASVRGDTVCNGGNAVVTATGTGIIEWFASPNGGISLGTGTNYTQGPISQNTAVYAQNLAVVGNPPAHLGPIDHQGSYFNSDQENEVLVFDAWADFKLMSVKVYTDIAGERTIELMDWWGNILGDTTVNIPIGTSRIGLNFNVPVGTGYTLGTEFFQNFTTLGYESPRLRRSDSGVSYPYEIANVASITGSSTGPNQFYYFYDWEVSTTDYFTCPSTRVPVQIDIEEYTGITIGGLNRNYLNTDPAVQIIPSIPNGTFSGRGINTDGNGRTYFSPALAGAKDSIAITYQFTSPAGCIADTIIYVSVLSDPSIGIAELNDNRLLFYPNPAQSTITITLPSELESAILSVLDATGKKVIETKLASGITTFTLDISTLAQGIFFLRLDDAKGSHFGKLSKL